MSQMVVSLLIGLPGQRPGGLLLSVINGVGSGGAALAAGLLYATACVEARRVGLLLQAAFAVLRGVPLLLLMFFLAQTTAAPLWTAGIGALFLYSLCHVGETLRSFLAAYPAVSRDQARVMGLDPVVEWALLRMPWTLRHSLDALGTHWISLLKDTGALVSLGVPELTTVAKLLSEQVAVNEWLMILGMAGLLYLAVTLVLIRALAGLKARYSFGGGGAT